MNESQGEATVSAPGSLPEPIDPAEAARLQALARFNVAGTPPDGTFDDITRMAAQWLRVPVAIVSLVDHDRIWFRSRFGLQVPSIPRDPGLCSSAILSPLPYVVPDARIDPRTLTNPLVAGDFGLQSYAAVPLTTHDGHRLGTLCVLDFKPRQFSAAETELLEVLGRVVMDQMQLRLNGREMAQTNRELVEALERERARTRVDAVTGLPDRAAIIEQIDLALRADAGGCPMAVLMYGVDHFKRVNLEQGYAAADTPLREVGHRLQRVHRVSDLIGRVDAHRFVVVARPCDQATAITLMERALVSCEMAHAPTGATAGKARRVTVSAVARVFPSRKPATVESLIDQLEDSLGELSLAGGARSIVID
jgi:diguanylate cyclase (GGDEF)-like protein